MIGGEAENARIHFTSPYFITQFPPATHSTHCPISCCADCVGHNGTVKDSSFLVLRAISVSALLDDELNVADSYLSERVVDEDDGEAVVLRMR